MNLKLLERVTCFAQLRTVIRSQLIYLRDNEKNVVVCILAPYIGYPIPQRKMLNWHIDRWTKDIVIVSASANSVSAPADKEHQDTVCVMCEFVMQQIDQYLEDNTTKVHLWLIFGAWQGRRKEGENFVHWSVLYFISGA